MIPDSRGQQNCTDPTYPTAPVLNPTCMAQFNQSSLEDTAEIARLRARVAQLEGAQ